MLRCCHYNIFSKSVDACIFKNVLYLKISVTLSQYSPVVG